VFLHYTQDLWPDLWRNLNAEIFRASDPPQIAQWAAKQGRGIVDRWFLEFLQRTVGLWRRYPDSPQAKLSEEAKPTPFWDEEGIRDVLMVPRWFQLEPVGPIRAFMPHHIREEESVERYGARLRRELSAHLEYVRYVRAENSDSLRHIKWAIEFLSGRSWAELQQETDTRTDADAIRKDASRLAYRIGLTLRPGADTK
jgi:hypothetical protein